MKSSVYPERYEIKEVCENFIKRRTLNTFMQERGIFAINASTEDVSTILSNIVWDAVAIEDLRRTAFQCSNKNSLSGFTVSSSLNEFSIKNVYETARDNDKVLCSKGYQLGFLAKETREDGTDVFKGQLDYEIRRPGRIQFIDKEEGHCEFRMFEKKVGVWQVEVDGTRTNDGKEVQRLFSQLLNKDRTTMHFLNIDNLRDKQTILFFDEVIKRGLSDEWHFNDVVALTFRRGRDEIVEEENDNEEQTSQPTLTGIRQAILEGGHLRDDAFVRRFEEDGCVFAAMTLAFQNTTKPEVIHIRAEFKGNPKIFEVSIVNSYVCEGTDGKLITRPLSAKRNLQIRSEFWNNSRNIYDEILSGEIKNQ